MTQEQLKADWLKHNSVTKYVPTTTEQPPLEERIAERKRLSKYRTERIAAFNKSSSQPRRYNPLSPLISGVSIDECKRNY